jgi:outer membrane lipoprotein-sorting protein
MASALTRVLTGRLRRFSNTNRLIKGYDTVTAMPIRSAFTVPLLACLAAGIGQCQPTAGFLDRLDRFARTFTGARANIRSIVHTNGIPDDDVETGVIFVKRSGGKTQFRIDFTQPNLYTAEVREETAEVYHPKLNEIDVYDLRAYKDIAQKLFLLGFGMPGRELAANYEIRTLRHDSVDAQSVTYLELIPKSPEVRKQLKSIEVWISDATLCPARQIFHMPDGSSRTAEFSAMEVNPKLPGNIFDLPKTAKRVKAN